MIRPIIGKIEISDDYAIVNEYERYALIPHLTWKLRGEVEYRYYGNGIRKIEVIGGKACNYIEKDNH